MSFEEEHRRTTQNVYLHLKKKAERANKHTYFVSFRDQQQQICVIINAISYLKFRLPRFLFCLCMLGLGGNSTNKTRLAVRDRTSQSSAYSFARKTHMHAPKNDQILIAYETVSLIPK